MNTLIVTAHPAEWGFTHKIAATYKEQIESQGGTVEVIDLFKETRQQEFLVFNESMREDTTDDQRYYQEKIRWANELVFVHPVWWMAMPAIMKNWIDWNFAPGFAFEYQDGKPKSLLDGKTARVFATGDGPKALYTFLAKPMMKTLFGKGVLNFVGIKCQSYDVFGNMVGRRNDAERGKMLENVRRRAGK